MNDVQIPRQAVIWILLAEFTAVLPHGVHLPLWMWGGVAFVFIWRWLCHLGRLSYPGRLVKVFFIV